MIFRRDKKRKAAAAEAEDAAVDTADESTEGVEESADTEAVADPETKVADADHAEVGVDLEDLDSRDWRGSGPWDITEVEEVESTDAGPRIDLGAMILTGVPGSELRLQMAEETQQIVSAMLVLETLVESDTPGEPPQAYTSALELGAYAAPRSGGLWAELRDEICEGAAESGGSASLDEGPFGVEVRRLIPVTTPDGEEGYQPSRMWVAEGPRWLLRGIVYGQAAIEADENSAVVRDVVTAFRQVVVRRGEEAMAPGYLLTLTMPANAVREASA
jgi:hypothetical protein